MWIVNANTIVHVIQIKNGIIKHANVTLKIVVSGKNIAFGILAYVTVCSCHVTFAFQSESTPSSCLNVKELLARNRREI